MRYVIRAANLIVASAESDQSLSTAHPVSAELPPGARPPETDEDLAALDAEPIPEIPEWYQRTLGLEPPSEVPRLGTIERLGNTNYVCAAVQTDVEGVMVNYFSPDALNGGWRPIALDGGLDPWAPGTYQLDEEVLYEPDGTEWRNRRPNNSQAFAPPVPGSGWMQIGPGDGPFPWKHVGNEGYPTPWTVTHPHPQTQALHIWFNPSPNTFWEPGVAVWVDQGPA